MRNERNMRVMRKWKNDLDASMKRGEGIREENG
jgi:hypothetical protein